MVLTHSHPPSLTLSFHKLTLLSPPLTASTFPLSDQLTRQMTHSKFNTVLCQLFASAMSLLPSVDANVQTLTLLSWPPLATYVLLSTLGLQATSRTQSLWPERETVSSYWAVAGLYVNTLTAASDPAVASRRAVFPGVAPGWGDVAAFSNAPGSSAGAQDTALQLILCAGMMAVDHAFCACAPGESLNDKTLTLPSELAQARCAPNSCGAQLRLLTEAVCSAKSIRRVQLGEAPEEAVSRQITTLPS